MISRFVLIALLTCTCMWTSWLTPQASAKSLKAPGIDRSEIVGTWEGIAGTGSRGATLLRFRLSLQTGLEAPLQTDHVSIEIDEDEEEALEEARKRAQAIREGRDPEEAIRAEDKSDSSAQKRSEAIESARLRRERNRADRVEGLLEFSPLYGQGAIRTGLGGVPSLEDATGSCEVVGYLNTYSGTLALHLTRWVDRPKTNLLQTNELQLVIDPSEPVLFGECTVRLAAGVSFMPVIAWPEGHVPDDEAERIEDVAYPNQFGGDRITRLRRNLSEYTRQVESLERERPVDDIDAKYASRYANAENRLASELASQKSTHERTLASYDRQEDELDAQEAAGDLSDSQRRRIASKRESIAARRTKAAKQFESRNDKSRERYADTVAELDERVANDRAELEEELAEYEKKLEELRVERSDVHRSITINNEVVSAWIEQIADEYPGIRSEDGLNFFGRETRHALQNGLRDDVFVPTFGAAYDDLTDYDMLLLVAYLDMRNEVYDGEGEVRADTGTSTSPPRDRGRVREAPAEAPTQPPASGSATKKAQRDAQRDLLHGGAHAVKAALTGDYERNLLRLYVQRRTANWSDRVRAGVEAMQPDADTFSRIDAIERALALRTHCLRPSEQDAALLITVGARREHADATAMHLAAETVQQARGQEGIASLSYFWARQPALDRLVSDETRSEINAKIDAGLDDAIVGVVQDLYERIKGLEETSDPHEALALGAGIYRDFLARIGAAKRRPAAQRILDGIAARRPADLMRVQKEVSSQPSPRRKLNRSQPLSCRFRVTPKLLQANSCFCMSHSARCNWKPRRFRRCSPSGNGLSWTRSGGSLLCPTTTALPA